MAKILVTYDMFREGLTELESKMERCVIITQIIMLVGVGQMVIHILFVYKPMMSGSKNNRTSFYNFN